jgi:hypothetical protein
MPCIAGTNGTHYSRVGQAWVKLWVKRFDGLLASLNRPPVRGALDRKFADMNCVMAVPAQEFDGLGRNPRVREEAHYLPAGIGWTGSSAITAA